MLACKARSPSPGGVGQLQTASPGSTSVSPIATYAGLYASGGVRNIQFFMTLHS